VSDFGDKRQQKHVGEVKGGRTGAPENMIFPVPWIVIFIFPTVYAMPGSRSGSYWLRGEHQRRWEKNGTPMPYGDMEPRRSVQLLVYLFLQCQICHQLLQADAMAGIADRPHAVHSEFPDRHLPIFFAHSPDFLACSRLVQTRQEAATTTHLRDPAARLHGEFGRFGACHKRGQAGATRPPRRNAPSVVIFPDLNTLHVTGGDSVRINKALAPVCNGPLS
jgi:hypothetical protein